VHLTDLPLEAIAVVQNVVDDIVVSVMSRAGTIDFDDHEEAQAIHAKEPLPHVRAKKRFVRTVIPRRDERKDSASVDRPNRIDQHRATRVTDQMWVWPALAKINHV
jgi:hypothetical protein